jgi:cysteine-rich repeat protein
MQYISLSRAAQIALVSAVAALASLVPTPVEAYCVNPEYATALRDDFASLRVPVYISIGANSTVGHLGVAQEDMARLVLEVIARHNETTVAPKLYFAGFSPNGLVPDPKLGMGEMMVPIATLNSIGTWPKGIMIHSFDCDLLASDVFYGSYFCWAAQDDLHGCGYQHLNDKNEFLGIVLLVPAMCDLAANPMVDWSIDGSTQYDLMATLLHEIGHVVGLGHTNIEATDCPGVAGNAPAGNTGVMRTTNGSSLPGYRHWRRDDIDGMDDLYAANYPDYELTLWPDDNFPAAPAIGVSSTVLDIPMIRSGSLADVPSDAEQQPLVSLDVDRRVVFATFAPDGSLVQPPAIVDPSPRGVTVGSPDVAFGVGREGERVFVTWTAGEEPTSEDLQPRWAVRRLSGGAWSLFDGPTRKTSRSSAGFDPNTMAWLLAGYSSDAELQLSIIAHDGALLLDSAPLGVAAFEFGNPICGHAGPGCTMLFTTTELGGPNLARIDFSLSVDPAGVSVDNITVFEGRDVYGRVDVAASDPGWLRVVAGGHRVELGASYGGILDPQLPQLTQLRDWPVALGRHDGVHRMTTLIAVECGNGILQSNEACDDGNLEPGDGCDDVCRIEVGGSEETSDSGGTGGGGEGTSDTGGTGGDFGLDEDGCTCAADERYVPGLGVLLGLMVFGCRSCRRLGQCLNLRTDRVAVTADQRQDRR